MTLEELGWSSFFEESFRSLPTAGLVPGRIAMQHRNAYTVYTSDGEVRAHVAGKLRYQAGDGSDFPAVGDWVALHTPGGAGAAIIYHILTRKSRFSRKVAGGRTGEQVVAANIDTAFLVSGLDGDFNMRRIERYLVLAYDSGAAPAIILNKTDLCENLPEIIDAVSVIAPGIPLLSISAGRNEGVEQIRTFLPRGSTGVLLGSSGVGKSTIINALLGRAVQKTEAVRENDSRGRHTTSRRELMLLDGGGMLMDTPGMRELQLWGDTETVEGSFRDIQDLALQCKFTDCRHDTEPGCAIQAALEEGVLDPERYASYQKLQREMAYLERKQDELARRMEKERVKKVTGAHKRMYKRK